ncbi:MAG: Flavodoxin reductases (ferredoxin-NADPH reductases) family 1 [uncultured Solirubrobacteraceae bacterium]|uniref:Flavodoxin reductases (Ferredoxin-NADPH reductases) family 1 n=1 Tax=uncultured Solirubrobacteraceae bacterium TaxID=1162706 RepID=A0A6J4TDF3_9ACTN|nr:MAG: Flavodoxin reductases (ferredoxin-NADPH reductases) family 1 [uncultured Solirubrobacteraceae bacterium]
MVERAAAPKIPMLRRRLLQAARAMTTPLLPDDYIGLLDPRWSTREATGSIVRVVPETDDAATVVIRPSHQWTAHKPGQYLRVGAEIDGRRHWRAYSITSDPDHPEQLVSITIKRVAEGLMSPWFVRHAKPGTLVFLGEVEGTFGLPDPLPAKILGISAGSGITPLMSMLRELDRRNGLDDVVHIHSVRTADRFIFGDMLRELAARRPGYTLHERLTGEHGRITPDELDDLVADWRERETFLSGPREMINALEAHYLENGSEDSVLHVERFQPVIGTGNASVGTGGTVFFRVQDVEAACEVGVSILVGGERAGALLPYGCRMGICHTCVGRLRAGQVRDLRTGELFTDEGQTIRTCINAPEGPIEIEL